MQVYLSVENLSFSYKEKTLFDQVSLYIHKHDKIGLIGKNGTGKSTLLKILAQRLTLESCVITQQKIRIGYLSQEIELNEEKTILENILESAQDLQELVQLYSSVDISLTNQQELEDKINHYDAWNLPEQAKKLINQFGLNENDKVKNLSGGQQKRLAICKCLMTKADVLILDEPTNHLDIASIKYLEEFLNKFKGAIIFISHDRNFLDNLSNRICELSQGKIFNFKGNYDSFLIQKEAFLQEQEVLGHKRKQLLKKELMWLRKGVKARGTKSKKRIQRYHDLASKDSFKRDDELELIIPAAEHVPNKTVKLHNITKKYANKTLFENFSFEFEAKKCIGLLGKNGLGKSTLIKIIMQQIQPCLGRVEIGSSIKFNYIDQHRKSLNNEATLAEEVAKQNQYISFNGKQISTRNYLKRFLFNDDEINTKVKYLSGGEKNRLLLAKSFVKGGNFIILDEPTNDLDLYSLQVLEESIINYNGCVICITHDRRLLNNICDGILVFEGNGTIDYYEGNYNYYLEKKLPNTTTKTIKKSKEKKKSSLSWKEKQELSSMEENITILEEQEVKLNEMFLEEDFYNKPITTQQELINEQKSLQEKIKNLYQRWEDLEQKQDNN